MGPEYAGQLCRAAAVSLEMERKGCRDRLRSGSASQRPGNRVQRDPEQDLCRHSDSQASGVYTRLRRELPSMAVLQDTGVTHTWGVTAALGNLLHVLMGHGDEAHSLDGFSHHPLCACVFRSKMPIS